MTEKGMGAEFNHDLNEVIAGRRTVRSFTGESPPREQVEQVVKAGLLAPYAALAISEGDVFRRFFVIPRGSAAVGRASEIISRQAAGSADALEKAMADNEEFHQKARAFAERVRAIAEGDQVGFEDVPWWIIVAERKGFPPAEARSLAHVMENMWLKATALGLGFRLISVVTQQGDSEEFCDILGIKAGQFGLDSCVIGYPRTMPGPTWRPSMEEAVTWLD
jgi:nitroreductase